MDAVALGFEGVGAVVLVAGAVIVGVLGLIVVIRTFLSFSLQIEIDGVMPWRPGSVIRIGRCTSGAFPQPARSVILRMFVDIRRG